VKAAVIVFPGSNCDRDLAIALEMVGFEVSKIWHKNSHFEKSIDLVAIPGGFSFGDYLRVGAIAANSPICKSIISHGERGGYILGVCNGFQILTETGLLPGALLRNNGLKYICKTLDLKVATSDSIFTHRYNRSNVIKLPIAHHDGNYNANMKDIERMKDQDLVAFRYCDNPNGSIDDIAGILSPNRRILGMMPHPERATEQAHGNIDGVNFFKGLANIVSFA
jgi:phosphoribosylformylglycinamidine synthase